MYLLSRRAIIHVCSSRPAQTVIASEADRGKLRVLKLHSQSCDPLSRRKIALVSARLLNYTVSLVKARKRTVGLEGITIDGPLRVTPVA